MKTLTDWRITIRVHFNRHGMWYFGLVCLLAMALGGWLGDQHAQQ